MRCFNVINQIREIRKCRIAVRKVARIYEESSH